MYPTELLWQAACRPAVHGLLDAAQYAALKRKPASYPPSGPCYLCGREIPGAAQPTSARFDDAGRLYVFRATGAERHRDQF